jgi:hypothetical protein
MSCQRVGLDEGPLTSCGQLLNNLYGGLLPDVGTRLVRDLDEPIGQRKTPERIVGLSGATLWTSPMKIRGPSGCRGFTATLRDHFISIELCALTMWQCYGMMSLS